MLVQGDGDVKRREDLRRRQTKPTTTLFVVNFDVENTVERDLERHFEQFGKLTRVQIKRNYAFIQYDDVESATAAVDNCHLSRLAGKASTCFSTVLAHACRCELSLDSPGQISR